MAMEEKRYHLQTATPLSIPVADADRLLALGDGECALLYLYILRTGGSLSVTDAARALGGSAENIAETAQKLSRAGLLADGGDTPLPPADELPEYRTEDILRRSRSDGVFQGLIAETQRVMGHALSTADLKTLFGIYDRLGMPSEVIMLLINHVAAQLRRRYGEGRLPTMRAIEKEAFRWANQEIMTFDQAEEYLARAERLAAESEKLRETLQIVGREPTASEKKYMDAWVAMGYSHETLAIAYDRTVVGTGKLSWAYMDKIVRSWYEKKLFTPEEIEKGDTRDNRTRPSYQGGRSGARPPRTDDAPLTGGDDLDRVARIFGKMKKEE